MRAAVWTPLALFALPLLRQVDEPPAPGPGVQPSSSCARCHSNAPAATAMRDAKQRPIAPFDLWRGTMMANSARDPLWRAVVSAEVAALPTRQAEIEATCLGCHSPMAEQVGLDDHGTGSLMHVLDCDSALGELARDGVSCTICHGISPEGLGTQESYSAGYRLNPERRLYGPHEAPFTMPMQRFTGFTPTHGEHISDSALCGTCHTLETPVLDAQGHDVGGVFLEQAPYLEWRNSFFNDELDEPGPLAASCQDCHAPTRDEDGEPLTTRIVRNPMGRDFPQIEPREPFGRHLFVGGNTLVLSMLRDHPEALGVEAPAEAFEASVAATRAQLRERTARVRIGDLRDSDDKLSFAVSVQNLTGHKLPSAHPTRRAWLRVVVRDESGQVLFASGDVDSRGRILGADGQPLGSELAGGPIEPHRDSIRTGDEVATYQAVMADSNGEPTHTLMRGAKWYVDDRLLPAGWDPNHPEAARTAPVGVDGDEDFKADGDRVHFELDLVVPGRLTIEASLLYQTLNARWAAELFRYETPEVELFRSLYDQADLTPEVLASDVWEG
ncbi:multiheme c-type cytochrome [Engelhardtia mirabilis]|uniref:Uncharacterized protein n=1 Tax=Engelhardtia mirabilis TaxID=2528011 RepID=A0A518BDY9_9BACT|nr:hypothetical protein Pla133_02730 [Planctomycetes bacterium Pla133]QDU99535.1 hypothetical protein Pla86_02730 [Planctomycetes bacterium Pla86]